MAARRQQFTYERQAKLSVILGVVGAVATLAAVGLLARNYEGSAHFVTYNPQGKWLLAFGGALLAGLLASGSGLLLGLVSAGQRRNTQSRLSWTGFFVCAGIITLALCAGLFFYFNRFAVR